MGYILFGLPNHLAYLAIASISIDGNMIIIDLFTFLCKNYAPNIAIAYKLFNIKL